MYVVSNVTLVLPILVIRPPLPRSVTMVSPTCMDAALGERFAP